MTRNKPARRGINSVITITNVHGIICFYGPLYTQEREREDDFDVVDARRSGLSNVYLFIIYA